MRVDVFNPPDPRMPAGHRRQRRAHFLSEISAVDRSFAGPLRRLLWGSSRRRVGLAAALLVLVGSVGTAIAVGTDLLTQQKRVHAEDAKSQIAPQPEGDAVQIDAGSDWSLVAWKSDEGICLDYAVPGNYISACGLPVVGSPPNTAAPDAEAPTHVVAGLQTVPDSGTLVVAGVAASTVSRVEVELDDGRMLEGRLYNAPAALDTSLRFFLLRATIEPGATDALEPRARAFQAYDASGTLLEDVSAGFGP
ncbi:MAG TPA: hypothetical protein VFW80_04515 [Gaiellaceae bacterium]|nr:hypothetical protein [Gaiellaceae bacterium]